MRLPVPESPDPDSPISVSYEEFCAATAMLRKLQYAVEVTDEQAWPDFRGWRVNYDATALLLARELDATPALWTGERRWPSVPIPPRRPALRRAADAAAADAAADGTALDSAAADGDSSRAEES
jgi:hypothetical protein